MIFKKYAALAVAVTLSAPIAATEFPPVGASGDAGFRDLCPAHQYLVGLRVRSGAWVDQMSITCARLDADGTLGDFFQGPNRGGDTGGAPVVKTCDNGIVTGMGLQMTAGNRQVREFVLNCISATTGRNQGTISLGNGVPEFPSIRQTCPSTEAATGIHGRFGRHVNAVGLICGPKPSRAALASTAARWCRASGGIWQGGWCRRPGMGSGGGLSADATAILDAHNRYRAKHCVSNLTWSAELAAGAQAWANACTPDPKNPNGFAHSEDAWKSETPPSFGENLAWGTNLSAQGAVDSWYAEKSQYDFNEPIKSFKEKKVGHFTQVVWRKSTQLGCAVNDCGGRKFWVCRYSLTGNWNIENAGVLEANVPRVCSRWHRYRPRH